MGPNQPVEITEQKEQTTALGKTRESKFLPQLLLALTLSTVTPTFTSCSDEPNNPYEQVDKIKPTITILQSPIDITWWKTINIKNWNELYIWDIKAATRDDNSHEDCTYELSLLNWQNKEHIYPGTTLTKSGTIELVVTDKSNNYQVAQIKLETTQEEPISWLENLEKQNITVDQEINLLEWISFGNGVNLKKVEIEVDWIITDVTNSYQNYIREYPCTYSVIITITTNWNDIPYRVDNLIVNPKNHTNPEIATASYSKNFSWFNKLNYQKNYFENFMPTLMFAYGKDNFPQNKRIVLWEAIEWTNIWWNTVTVSDHSKIVQQCIENCTDDEIIGCDSPEQLEDYLITHPFESFTISCSKFANFSTASSLNNPGANALKRILDMPNVIVICCSGDTFDEYRIVNNVNITNPEFGKRKYNYSSINSKFNKNKITAVSQDEKYHKNYFSPKPWEWLDCLMPYWCSLEQWNIVMSSPSWINNGDELNSTASSFPAATINGIIWTMIKIIQYNYPWINPSEAMDKIIQNYFKNEKITYENENNIVESDYYKYTINTENFTNNEILHIPEIESIQTNSDMIELPSYEWLWYMGPWIMFEYKWKLYEASKENESIEKEALKQWNQVKWSFNKTLYIKYWWNKEYISFSNFAVDTDWEKIPNIGHNFTITNSSQKYNYNISNSWYNNNYNTSNSRQNYFNH